jgi:hypothetical protein
MVKAYNKRVIWVFKKRDQVLKKILLTSGEDQSKWASKYEGLYVVNKAFPRKALVLTKMDGDDLPNPENSNIIKMYYAQCTLSIYQ